MPRIILIALILCGCTSSIELDRFNSEQWKSDLMGCSNLRKQQVERVMEQKEAILRKSEADIITVFGAPDKNELYGRNQKLFVYYTSPGPVCNLKNDSTSYLSIRFNAVGISSEVLHFQSKIQ